MNKEPTDELGAKVSETMGVVQPPENQWDTKNSRSLLNLMPERWQGFFEEAHAARPELFELDERLLYNTLRKENKTPNAAVNTIRLKLWMEYERCQAGQIKKIEIFRVLGEVCRNPHFEKFILSRADRCAWIMCPPTSYKMKIDEALDYGIGKLRDILDLDIVEDTVDENGKVIKRKINVKLAEIQVKIVNMLDLRVHGAPTQKIDQRVRALGILAQGTVSDVANAALDHSESEIERLDKQLAALEQRDREARRLPSIIPEPGAVPVPKTPIEALAQSEQAALDAEFERVEAKMEGET